jgi:flagellar hook-associated protein 3 FlgL
MYQSLSRSVTNATERVNRATNELGSGQRVIRVSDSPTDASQLLRLDTELHANETFTRSTTDAAAWVAVIDNSLFDMNNVLARADELGQSALNGSISLAGRQALGAELLQLRDQFASAANTTYLGQAVFAGHSTLAVDPTTYAFTGTVGQVLRQLDLNTTSDVAMDGEQVLGFNAGPGLDVFSVLTNLAAEVNNVAFSPANVQAARANLDARRSDITTALGVIGTRTQEIERVASRLIDSNLETQKARAAIGDVDMAKAVLEVQTARTAYEAALQAVSQATLPSLADYL